MTVALFMRKTLTMSTCQLAGALVNTASATLTVPSAPGHQQVLQSYATLI